MKKILLLLLLIPLNLKAIESYVVLDPSNNRVLSSSNKDEVLLIASTTKIMTALVAIENYSLTDILCAGEEINEVYGSNIYIEKNECMSLYVLLVGLLLRSGNDAAVVIAYNTLGYDNFIKKMNELAIKIGMHNTNFSNPHGLDDKDENTSTAYDLAIMMSYAMKNDIFREITSLKKYIVESNKKTYIWINKNELLFNYKFATGGKTGYTSRSGYLLVSSATKAKESLIIVTIKDNDRFNTHKNMYEKYFKEYDKYKILNKYTFYLDVDYYKDYNLYIKEDIDLMLNKNETVDLKVNIIKKENVSDEEVVGRVKVLVDDKNTDEVNIYAVKNNKESIFSKIYSYIKSII